MLRPPSVGTPSALRRCPVGAPSALRRCSVGTPSALRRRSVLSVLFHHSVGAPLALRRCCVNPNTLEAASPAPTNAPYGQLGRVRPTAGANIPSWCNHPKLIHSTHWLKSVFFLAPAGPSSFNAYMRVLKPKTPCSRLPRVCLREVDFKASHIDWVS